MVSIFWQLIIGLGIFLYGMSQLERAINSLGNTAIKNWLLNSTQSRVSSVASGVVYTSILQSSSMVSLLVLAFASAGLLPLFNAIGVLLGANLGTTFTGWIVATLGFKLDLDAVAIPLLGIGALIHIAAAGRQRIAAFGQLLLGLGVLLFGLFYMKNHAAELASEWDVSKLQGFPPVIYLMVGILIAALVQSSSAVMMMTLAALNEGFIQLPDAAALVIGADLGTTSTTLLASLTGAAIKRRLAFAHLFFNLTVDLFAFFFLLPLLPVIMNAVNLDKPLYSLVAFHSIFNLIGILLFLPFLGHYSRWIGKLFSGKEAQPWKLTILPSNVPEAAVAALIQQMLPFWLLAAKQNLQQFGLTPDSLKYTESHSADIFPEALEGQDNDWVYENIKTREVEIINYVVAIQQQPLSETLSATLTDLLEMSRTLVYNCKSIRDISDDIDRIKQMDKHSLAMQILQEHQKFLCDVYSRLLPLMYKIHNEEYINEHINQLLEKNTSHQDVTNLLLYKQNTRKQILNDGNLYSTLLNVNREVHHATNSLLSSVLHWHHIRLRLIDKSETLAPAVLQNYPEAIK